MNQNLENAIVLQDGLFYDPDLEEIVFNEKKLPLTFHSRKLYEPSWIKKERLLTEKL